MSFLCHYGMPRRSGRYPYGSGDRPYQREKNQIEKKQKVVKFLSGKNIDANKLVSKNSIDTTKDFNLKKGEKVQHISGVDMNKLRPGQLYVTATEYDNKLYEAFLSGMLLTKGYGSKKITLTLKEDLKSPSADKQYSIFKNELKKEEVLNDISDWLVSKGKFDNKESALRSESKKNDREIYSDFINSCESKSASRTKFYDSLKKEGYNSVLDVHDRDSWISGKQPIILIEALDVIGDLKMENLKNSDINKALEEWLEMNK